MSKLDQKLEIKRKIAINFFGRSKKKNTSYNVNVKKYYKNTKWLLFRLFGSKDGFMHIGLISTISMPKIADMSCFNLLL